MASNRWTQEIDAFRERLDDADKANLNTIKSQEGLKESLRVLERQSSALGDEKNRKILDLVVGLMDPIATLADALAPAACVPSGSIWGAFGLIIEMTHSKREFVEAILNNYKAFLTAAPRMEDYLKDENLKQSEVLQSAIEEVFTEFLSLTLQCMRTFGQNQSSSLNIMQKIRWVRDKKKLQRSNERIQKLAEDVDKEAERVARTQARRSQVAVGTSQIAPEPPKRKTMIPFVKNRAFSGRSGYLKQIHSWINPQAVLDSGEQQSVVLCGLAGIGKTQVALQYAHLHQDEYDACFWITCDTKVKISKDVAETARILGLGDQGRDHNSTMVKEWMSSTDERWLLVLDNVESSDDVQEIWPSCNRGSILVTTQDSGWQYREDIKHWISIQPMETEDGVAMVRAVFDRQKQSISTSAAERICKESGGQALSIRQLSSYICANREDPDQFLDTYPRLSGRIDSWDEGMPPSYQHTLSTFLDLTVKKLLDCDISLISQFAFLDPDSIQENLLYDRSQESEFRGPIGKLCRYSLISKTRNGDSNTFNIHRTVKRYLLNHLTDDQLREAIDSLTTRLRQFLPPQTPWENEASDKKWEHSNYIPHIVAINKEYSKVCSLTKNPQVLAQNLLHGAFDLWTKGVLEDGRELIDSALDLSNRPGFDDPLSAEIISFKGTLLADSGELDAAQKCFQTSHDIQQRWNKEMGGTATFTDEIYLANSYNNLAGIYCALGNYKEADIHNQLSIFLKEKWRDRNSTENRSLSHLLCLSYQNQAHSFAKQRRYEEAEEMFKNALREGEGEVSAARQALTYHNYGCMKLEQGFFEEACELLKSACVKREESIDRHPDTAVSQHMLAVCYQKRKDGSKVENLQLARDLLSDAVSTLEPRTSASNKKRLARTLFRLSMIFDELGDPEAAPTRSRAERLYFDLTGGNMPQDERSYDDLVPYI